MIKGVVLAEIAFWHRIQYIAKTPRSKKDQWCVIGTDIKTKLLDQCDQNLPHLVGQVFYRCVKTCLKFQEATKSMDQYETQVYFQREVVQKLSDLAGRV